MFRLDGVERSVEVSLVISMNVKWFKVDKSCSPLYVLFFCYFM